MCSRFNLLNRIFSVLLIMGMLLSLGVPQPVTAADAAPPVMIVDGAKMITGPLRTRWPKSSRRCWMKSRPAARRISLSG